MINPCFKVWLAIFLAFPLWSSAATAKTTTLECIGPGDYATYVKFDEQKQTVERNARVVFAAIDANKITFREQAGIDQYYFYSISRQTGVMTIYDTQREVLLPAFQCRPVTSSTKRF